MKQFSSDLKTDLSLLFITVIWASNFTVIKVSLVEFDPYSFNVVRYVLAAIFMWIVLIRKKVWLPIKKQDWVRLLALSFIGNVVYQGLFIIGINLTNAANTAVIIGTIPIWVALFSHMMGVEKMNRIKTIGIFFAFAGVILIITFGKNPISFGSDTFLGDVLILASAVVWGIFTLLSKPYLNKYSPLQFSTIMVVSGAVYFVIFTIPFYSNTDWQNVSVISWSGAVYSGLLSIGLAYLIWNNGLKKVGVVRTATYQNLVPVLGLLFGVILLGEVLETWQYIGSVIVILGILITRHGKIDKAINSIKSGSPH